MVMESCYSHYGSAMPLHDFWLFTWCGCTNVQS